MEALIKMVAEKTGITESQATTAVNTVVDFMKDKLPAGIGDNLQELLDGKGGLDGIKDKLGNMFGL